MVHPPKTASVNFWLHCGPTILRTPGFMPPHKWLRSKSGDFRAFSPLCPRVFLSVPRVECSFKITSHHGSKHAPLDIATRSQFLATPRVAIVSKGARRHELSSEPHDFYSLRCSKVRRPARLRSALASAIVSVGDFVAANQSLRAHSSSPLIAQLGPGRLAFPAFLARLARGPREQSRAQRGEGSFPYPSLPSRASIVPSQDTKSTFITIYNDPQPSQIQSDAILGPSVLWTPMCLLLVRLRNSEYSQLGAAILPQFRYRESRDE